MFCLGLTAPLFADGTTQPAVATPTASTNAPDHFTDEKSRVSYALGMMNGHQWKTQDLDLDPDQYAQGIKDALADRPTLLTEDQAKQVLDGFRREFVAKQQAKKKEQAIKNKADGEAFLSTNKLAPGIKELSVALPNGQTDSLQYLVLTNGSGPLPKAGDKVTVNYRGTLLDGTEFDSSYKHGRPATFQVGEVIKGWTEALKNMPVGSKWRLFIPADLAYGENGRSGIPGNALLTFDVELLDIQAPPPAPAPLTSDIIRVPGMDEIKKGAKPEVIKAEDVPKIQAQEQQQQQLQQTNH
jgi:FKBP-type peptidyl-prolyl cis-trans isomerase